MCVFKISDVQMQLSLSSKEYGLSNAIILQILLLKTALYVWKPPNATTNTNLNFSQWNVPVLNGDMSCKMSQIIYLEWRTYCNMVL